MGLEEDVLKLGKKLEKKISNNDCDSALDLLERLKETKITLEVLQKTKIGMTVNNLRKQTKDEQVITAAKALIKNWKKLLPDSGSAKTEGETSGIKADSEKKEAEGGGDSGSSTPKDDPDGSQSEVKPMSSMVTYTGDSVRLKCREMLSNALQANKPEETEGLDFDDMGGQIEDAIYDVFSDTGIKYKNCVRSRVFNLKDSKNPMLSANVMCGFISPEKLASMTSEEMASSEMKNLRDVFTKEAIKDHQMAKTGRTNTSLFKCGRCGKSSCSYNQLQTRSADEPMTTFVFCNDCGHRWKFC